MVSFTYVGSREEVSNYKIKLVNGLQQSLQLININTKAVVDFINLKEPIRAMNSGWFNHVVIISEFEATDHPIAEYKRMKAIHDIKFKPIPIIDFIIDHNDKFMTKYNQTLEHLIRSN